MVKAVMSLYEKATSKIKVGYGYSDQSVPTSNFIKGIQRKFANWKDFLEGLKINNEKAKLMVSGSKGELPISKIDPCDVCRKSHHKFYVVYEVQKVDRPMERLHQYWWKVLFVKDVR